MKSYHRNLIGTKILLIIFIIFSSGKWYVETNQKVEKLSFYKYKEIYFKAFPKQYVLSKKYINLEMDKDDNYVVLIDKIIIRNKKIYVLDKRKKCIAIFDEAGKYLGILSRYRTDYGNIADFDVNDKGQLFIIDGKLDNFLSYDSKLNLLFRKTPSFETDIVESLHNGNFLLGLSSWNQKYYKGVKLMLVDNNLNQSKDLLNYDRFIDDKYWIADYYFIKTNKDIYYNRQIDNNVYVFSIEDGELKKKYYFDFGSMNVPDADKYNIEKKISKFNNYKMLTNFTYVDDKCALGKIYDRRKFEFFYVDRVNNKVLLEDKKSPNELSNICNFDGQDLVSFIYPGEYTEYGYNGLAQKNKEHLKKGGIVICDYKLKQ